MIIIWTDIISVFFIVEPQLNKNLRFDDRNYLYEGYSKTL